MNPADSNLWMIVAALAIGGAFGIGVVIGGSLTVLIMEKLVRMFIK